LQILSQDLCFGKQFIKSPEQNLAQLREKPIELFPDGCIHRSIYTLLRSVGERKKTISVFKNAVNV